MSQLLTCAAAAAALTYGQSAVTHTDAHTGLHSSVSRLSAAWPTLYIYHFEIDKARLSLLQLGRSQSRRASEAASLAQSHFRRFLRLFDSINIILITTTSSLPPEFPFIRPIADFAFCTTLVVLLATWHSHRHFSNCTYQIIIIIWNSHIITHISIIFPS